MEKCLKCNREFKNKRSYYGHLAHCGVKDKPKECTICGKEVDHYNHKRHLKAHDKDTECLECGKKIYFFENGKKFCSSSCSAKYNNNRRVCEEERRKRKCETCGCDLNRGRKYCSQKCHKKYMWEDRKKKYIEEDNIPSPTQRRRFLLERDGNVCSICGRYDWEGRGIPLVADHIDGNSENNSISNLRLVCCNCDALLPTYKAKNIGNGRANRRKRYKEGKSY